MACGVSNEGNKEIVWTGGKTRTIPTQVVQEGANSVCLEVNLGLEGGVFVEGGGAEEP